MRPQSEPSFQDARRYLLGAMRAEELVTVEEALLDSGEFLEVVLAAEDELLDDYVAGTLAENEETVWMLISESSDEGVLIEGCIFDAMDDGSEMIARVVEVVKPGESFGGHTFEELRAMGLTSVEVRHPLDD